MVKTKTEVITKTITIIFAIMAFLFNVFPTFAVESDTNFQVNVKESLTVSISIPSSWASGDIDTFLRNKVSLYVNTNNPGGFTASMTMKTAETSLINTTQNSVTLPTLSSGSTRGSFPANYWGYSLGTTATLNSHTYNETDEGNLNSYYYPLVSRAATPITVLYSSSASSGSQDIYFGAKANATKASGTYVGTVVINVVTGAIDNNTNPATPTDPVTPGSEETPTYNPSPTGGSSTGTTSYTYRRTGSGTSTTTTEISEGNNVSAYDSYTPPQGVFTDTISNLSEGSNIMTTLATAAAVATGTGLFAFITAKRREIDEDEIVE